MPTLLPFVNKQSEPIAPRVVQASNSKIPSLKELRYQVLLNSFSGNVARRQSLPWEAWEASAGNHTKWQGDRKKLPVFPVAGDDLNAFYDRESFSFFHKVIGDEHFFSGASTDVVAHEVGHGLLDSIREDLFEVNFLEVGAFHEAAGDCMAILTALSDKETRQKLLEIAPDLRKKNFVESIAEDLAFGIQKLLPGHNAGEPRHAFNTLQYQLPQSLPATGGPGELINEEHSFGMIFTGCFWDLIANIFNASANRDEESLAQAAITAGKILISGMRSAVVTPRFLQSVGRAMVLADQTSNNAANREHIRSAFQAHNVLLGTNTMVAPSMSLSGNAPKDSIISESTLKDLRSRLRVTRGGKLLLAAVDVFGTAMIRVVSRRFVDLSSIDKVLKGIFCHANDTVMVGSSGTRAAVMGTMPHTDDSDQETMDFVRTLLEHGRIDLGKKLGALEAGEIGSGATHFIRQIAGKKVLVRRCYHCGG